MTSRATITIMHASHATRAKAALLVCAFTICACENSVRLVAPLSGALVYSDPVSLRWAGPPGDYEVEVCMTSSCDGGATTVIAGYAWQAPGPFLEGAHFWRVRHMASGARSATWEFFAAPGAVPRQN